MCNPLILTNKDGSEAGRADRAGPDVWPGLVASQSAHTDTRPVRGHIITRMGVRMRSERLTIFLGVAWERGDMISPHS